MSEALPPEVRNLLSRDLATMEHVEVLLRLHSDAARAWTVTDLAALVHTTPSSVTSRLDDLVTSGLASQGTPGTYRYAPRTPEMQRAVESLEEMYRTKPVTLVKAIYEKPASAVQSFADAFRLRKTDT